MTPITRSGSTCQYTAACLNPMLMPKIILMIPRYLAIAVLASGCGERSGSTYSAMLTFHRIDQPAPFDWTVNATVAVSPQ